MINYNSLTDQVLLEIWNHWIKERLLVSKQEKFLYTENYNQARAECIKRNLY